MKVARNEKRKKLLGFSFYTNIGNFEAFLWNLNLSTKHLFWRCVIIYYCMDGLPSKFAPKCAQIRSTLTSVLEAASSGFFAQLACKLCRQCIERSPSYIASIICSIYLCTYVYSCISTFYLPLKVHFTVPLLLLLPASLCLLNKAGHL